MATALRATTTTNTVARTAFHFKHVEFPRMTQPPTCRYHCTCWRGCGTAVTVVAVYGVMYSERHRGPRGRYRRKHRANKNRNTCCTQRRCLSYGVTYTHGKEAGQRGTRQKLSTVQTQREGLGGLHRVFGYCEAPVPGIQK